jgi:hypothetical protein
MDKRILPLDRDWRQLDRLITQAFPPRLIEALDRAKDKLTVAIAVNKARFPHRPEPPRGERCGTGSRRCRKWKLTVPSPRSVCSLCVTNPTTAPISPRRVCTPGYDW